MLGSPVLDVAIGLIFTFMAVSLAASALTEAVGSALKLRQRTLLQGVQALVNDPDFSALAKDLYNHALINPLSSGTAGVVAQLASRPAYIDSQHFAVALVQILQRGNPGAPLDAVIAKVPDEQLRQALAALLSEAKGDVTLFQAAIGQWFDNAMDRLSGWYKRYTQVLSFAAALLVCIILNADALHAGRTLWQHPSLVQELQVSASTPEKVSDALKKLDADRLIGWQDWTLEAQNPVGQIASMVMGWCLVAAASLFGASFWFDLLQRFVQLKGVGRTSDSKT